MAEKKDNVTSKFKDNVFCMLYRDKKNLLELYNALNNSAYTNVDDLQVTTLNGGSYMKYKNDASFLLCMSLYMFEQQSSKNPNMPLRFLHYVSDVFRELFSNSMKVKKSKTLETIASELEEEVADIKPIYDVVIAAAPDYNIDIIKNKLAIN